jgi:hypothetical protein
LINSFACNGSINARGVAVGALSCVCTNNSQCQEVYGTGYTCQSNNCVSGGTSIIYGDPSGDGIVSVSDATLTAQASLGLVTLTSQQIQLADVSGNGSVTAYDAALIILRIAGIISKFPVE